MTITFKTKVKRIYYANGELAYSYIAVPNIKRHHCDMGAFRKSRKFGSYANSDLFPAMLKRELEALIISDTIRLDVVPPEVSIDASGFLANVTITLKDS